MAKVDYWTAIPSSLGKRITDAVHAFGQEMNLEVEVWIHDMPLWSLSQHEPDGIIRRLQIGAYRMDHDEELRLITQVLRLSKDGRSLVALREIGDKLIVSRPLRHLGSAEQIRLLFKQAWYDLTRLPAPEQQSPFITIPLSSLYRQ